MRENPIIKYVKWLAHGFQELKKSSLQNYIYKITGKELCEKTGEEKLLIQVAGKNVFLQLTPKELILDEDTLRGFSPLDVRTITYMACNTENQSKEKRWYYRVIAQFFSKNRKEEMFVIQTEKDVIQITKSAQEISSNPNLINKFHPQDAHKIGYVSGTEQMIIESNFMAKQKNKSIN